jgi:hypothetical protein
LSTQSSNTSTPTDSQPDRTWFWCERRFFPKSSSAPEPPPSTRIERQLRTDQTAVYLTLAAGIGPELGKPQITTTRVTLLCRTLGLERERCAAALHLLEKSKWIRIRPEPWELGDNDLLAVQLLGADGKEERTPSAYFPLPSSLLDFARALNPPGLAAYALVVCLTRNQPGKTRWPALGDPAFAAAGLSGTYRDEVIDRLVAAGLVRVHPPRGTSTPLRHCRSYEPLLLADPDA